MSHVTFARLVAGVFGAALAVAVSTASAHTTIRSQATEGVTEDNALKIGHTCETADESHIPVIAQSVIFPTLDPVLTASDGSTIANLAQVIEQGSLVGLGRPIQDKSVFKMQRQKYDELGNVIGFEAAAGSLDPEIPGRAPFQYAAPRFVAGSCAKRLLIKVAIADICVRGTGMNDSIAFGKVNLWIPDDSSQIATLAKSRNVDGVGGAATLTVNRNLTTNPLAAACGAGIDVTVTPSAADIDKNMPIAGFWP